MPHTEPAVVVSSGMRRAAGDLYELAIAPPDASLSNADLAPTTIAQRTWTTYHVASLWVGLSVCIPTYMLAASLVGAGMDWKQAIFTIMLGNLIVLVPMVLIAHAGTRYGIPFPVLARASFGILGANVPALMRALVACGWFGIQTWIGGQAIYTMLRDRHSPAGSGAGARPGARLPRVLGAEHLHRRARQQRDQARWRPGRRRS